MKPSRATSRRGAGAGAAPAVCAETRPDPLRLAVSCLAAAERHLRTGSAAEADEALRLLRNAAHYLGEALEKSPR